MRTILIFLTLFLSFVANAAWVDADRQELAIKNVLQEANSGFENGKASWVASGGTFATVTSGTNLLTGKVSGTWDSSAAAQTFCSKLVAIPKGLYGRNGLGRIKAQVPSGAATHTIYVNDGTNNISTPVSIVSSTTPAFNDLNFIFPSSGSIKLCVTSVASNEPLIALDDALIGDAANYLNVSQASFVGGLKWVGVSSCNWSTSSTTWVGFSADSDCTTPAGSNLYGSASAPATKIPAVTFSSLSPGEYYIVATGSFLMNLGGANPTLRFHDGTTGAASNSFPHSSGATTQGIGFISGRFKYTTAQTNITFQIQGAMTGGGAAIEIQSDNPDYRELEIRVYKFPDESQLVQKPDEINWRVDANISGANFDLGTSNQASYVEMINAGQTMTQNTGSTPVGVACSTTNNSIIGNLTCAAGSESNGVTFNIPIAGDYKACVAHSHYVDNSASSTVIATFQVVETASNAQTILQQGKDRTTSTMSLANEVSSHPFKTCGTFYFSSSGQKTLRLMYEQLITNTPDSNIVLADANATIGQVDVHWTVDPLNGQATAAPIINSVTSPSTGAERVARTTISGATPPSNCTSDPCTIQYQSGSWITAANRSGTGAYSVTIAGSTFSSTPTCVCNATTVGVADRSCTANAQSTTSVTIGVHTGAGTGADGYYYLMCMGPR